MPAPALPNKLWGDIVTDKELCTVALAARQQAYAPYSGCLVGAALLAASGRVYTGVNVENASYGATLCAERAAFAKAIGAGERDFVAIAIAGGLGDSVESNFLPCGICRQVMAELCSREFFVYVATERGDPAAYRLEELLPHAFDRSAIR